MSTHPSMRSPALRAGSLTQDERVICSRCPKGIPSGSKSPIRGRVEVSAYIHF